MERFTCVNCPNEIEVDVDAECIDGTYYDRSVIKTEGAEKVPATLFAGEPEYICAGCAADAAASLDDAKPVAA